MLACLNTLNFVKNMTYDPDPFSGPEILSPTTTEFDRTTKKDLYARFGVREMWVVDTEQSTIEIHDFDGCHTVFLGAGDRLTSAVLPGFQARVEEVFA